MFEYDKFRFSIFTTFLLFWFLSSLFKCFEVCDFGKYSLYEINLLYLHHKQLLLLFLFHIFMSFMLQFPPPNPTGLKV